MRSASPLGYPAPGNHEWYDLPTNGAGYFDYFNGSASTSGARASEAWESTVR